MQFLRGRVSEFDRVIILGDLFDVWPGTTPFLKKHFEPVTAALRSLSKTGHEVVYVEGNHDFRLGRYFEEELGIRVYPNEWITEFGGRRAYLAHGDLGNPDDVGYRVLRRVLRSNLLHFAVSWMPGEWIYQVGTKTSGLSRGMEQVRMPSEDRVREIYRKTAKEILKAGNFDCVLFGHTHIPDDFKMDLGGREGRYLNSGDWLRNFTYLEFDGTDFYTKRNPLTES